MANGTIRISMDSEGAAETVARMAAELTKQNVVFGITEDMRTAEYLITITGY